MKISIIGAGAVGTEIVNYLMLLGHVSEIVLVDKSEQKAEGEILDFSHTESFTYSKNTKLLAGSYPDCKDSNIVVLTAGTQIKQGQSREELARVNSGIITDITRDVAKYAPNSILVVVTNPVDVSTYFAVKASAFDPSRIIGTGTVLDTARFMQIVGKRLEIDPKNVFGYVLGEHGRTSFIPWSLCNVSGMNIDSYCELNELEKIDKAAILQEMLDAGYSIFKKKKNTNRGIAAGVYRIIRAIAINEHSILPLGIYINDLYGLKDIVMSVPVVVNQTGIEKIVKCKFAENELLQLEKSAEHIRHLIDSISQ